MLSPFHRGFTLVELLIVVAIIGVLSTVGVPTFRRMVQKSKKAEAKVSLGGLYRAETGFFTEYQTYGNSLPHIGFELEGASGISHKGYYTVGFPATLAAVPVWPPSGSVSCANASLPEPSDDPAYSSLVKRYPAYGSTGYTWIYWSQPSGSGGGKCLQAMVKSDGSDFLATASGMIAPIAPAGAPATSFDFWSITSKGTLANDQDGTK